MKPISGALKTLGIRTKKILWVLGLHAFLLILFLIFVDLILGGIIFYKYVFLAETEVPQITESAIKFDTKTYQAVLGELQLRGQVNESP